MSRLQNCSVFIRLAGTLAQQTRSLSAGAESNRLLFQSLRSAHSDRAVYTPESLPLDTGRPRLVVLGTGWAAARLCRDIDPKLYDITVSAYTKSAVESALPARAPALQYDQIILLLLSRAHSCHIQSRYHTSQTHHLPRHMSVQKMGYAPDKNQ